MDKSFKRIIGLTGGIATGKTIVSSYIKQNFNIPILDADIYARDAIKINSNIFKLIQKRYGKNICLRNGELDYQKLGNILFHDVKQKEWLENKIHPYVKQVFTKEIRKSNTKVLIFDLPLLFESKLTFLITEVWIVYCDQKEQLRRLINRNCLTKNEGIIRIKNQLSFKDKIDKADYVLDNSSTLANLYVQINKIIEETNLYLR
ncbi:dephospho-CoA kinase [Candidatus Atelocyanobacterium thalassae]|uniref:Dephospho-CoA kinase n=1 Tax=cyanobacterium endosymbiont of Braarudosphaera bigelowii TaxID=1285375 RepID=A0ABM7U4K3_9CHRO|nr:dephospho-CoA kinase [Candidatus Atelocyanobacterium thalassa]BDA39650.1 dephospho-CoA kinase [cyanobacterium endosymbiont of Braarudosphaera bigelowii]